MPPPLPKRDPLPDVPLDALGELDRATPTERPSQEPFALAEAGMELDRAMDELFGTHNDREVDTGAVFDRYRLDERLGMFEEGELWSATFVEGERSGQRCALKTLSPAVAPRGSDRRRRFLAEGLAAAHVRHPNVVEVYGSGEVDGVAFVVRELVEGLNLGAWIAAHGRHDLAQFVELGTQIAEGLAAIHRARDDAGDPLELIHAELSPSAILVGTDGRLRLTEPTIAVLGARPVDHARAGRRGRLGFQAPEQVLGRPLEPRTDLFSLALVLVELLDPRPEGRAVSVRIEEVAGRIEARCARARAPGALTRLLLAMASARPSERPPTASSVATALRALRPAPAVPAAVPAAGPPPLPAKAPAPSRTSSFGGPPAVAPAGLEPDQERRPGVPAAAAPTPEATSGRPAPGPVAAPPRTAARIAEAAVAAGPRPVVPDPVARPVAPVGPPPSDAWSLGEPTATGVNERPTQPAPVPTVSTIAGPASAPEPWTAPVTPARGPALRTPVPTPPGGSPALRPPVPTPSGGSPALRAPAPSGTSPVLRPPATPPGGVPAFAPGPVPGSGAPRAPAGRGPSRVRPHSGVEVRPVRPDDAARPPTGPIVTPSAGVPTAPPGPRHGSMSRPPSWLQPNTAPPGLKIVRGEALPQADVAPGPRRPAPPATPPHDQDAVPVMPLSFGSRRDGEGG